MSAKFSKSLESVGNADWFRDVVTPLAQTLDGIADAEIPEELKFKGSAQNGPLGAALVGFTLFALGKLTGKFLDDFYSTIIQPRVLPALKSLDAKITNLRQQKCVALNVWHPDNRVLVRVLVFGANFDEIAKQVHLVPAVHYRALEWIAANGRQKTIHCYELRSGAASTTPQLYDSLGQSIAAHS
jgi:hypothetical protein